MSDQKYNPKKFNPVLAEFMGWTQIGPGYYQDIPMGDRICAVKDWTPNTDLNQAFMVVDKLESMPRTGVMVRTMNTGGRQKTFRYHFTGIDSSPFPHGNRKEAIYSAICAAIHHLNQDK